MMIRINTSTHRLYQDTCDILRVRLELRTVAPEAG